MAQETTKPTQSLQSKKPNLSMHKGLVEAERHIQGLKDESLLTYAEKGDEEEVRWFLDHGADIEAKDGSGWTPLMNAARKGKTGTCALLLERGADINAEAPSGFPGSWTAFKIARFNRHPDTAAFLLLHHIMSIESVISFRLAFEACVSGGL